MNISKTAMGAIAIVVTGLSIAASKAQHFTRYFAQVRVNSCVVVFPLDPCTTAGFGCTTMIGVFSFQVYTSVIGNTCIDPVMDP
jgi:hypothetical protein